MNVVTQENIRSIIPSNVSRIAALYSRAKGASCMDALILFYKTPMYKDLEIEETKVWWQSPEEIFEDWCRYLEK